MAFFMLAYKYFGLQKYNQKVCFKKKHNFNKNIHFNALQYAADFRIKTICLFAAAFNLKHNFLKKNS